ncbi:hypothetical protein BpHYR1_009441 [Brachionus plicatilis]|uniref:Uncharacterized protein n=1 Tax=Brachionus plicatilis TaxID=10195 RepID=A0A3M7QQT6_BRAPC|nr:hypothetical protein BpHYR1_009441 [Brachionus plicatilis]
MSLDDEYKEEMNSDFLILGCNFRIEDSQDQEQKRILNQNYVFLFSSNRQCGFKTFKNSNENIFKTLIIFKKIQYFLARGNSLAVSRSMLKVN